MIYDKGIAFHFLHKADGQPLKYVKMCTKDDKIVPWNEVVRGYEVAKNEYITFDQKELNAAKPESDKRIRISKFVDYFSVDPVYFDRTYALLPDKSKEAYGLLLKALEKTNKAGAGRITLRTKEYPALLHTYKGALVLTTLRYAYDVVDPQDFEPLHKLEAPEKAELDLAVKIVTDLSGEFDITEFEDTYMKRVQELVKQKLKGEKITHRETSRSRSERSHGCPAGNPQTVGAEMSRHIYLPMLAKVAAEAFSDKDWIFEVKWDGFRAIAYVEEPFSLKSRNGKELKNNFPELGELNRLGSNIVVDGEIIVMREGKPDFQSLLERGQAVSTGEIQRQATRAPAVYIVFDILEKDGKSLTNLPLMERKKILKDSLREGANVLLCDFIEEKGEAYFQLALEKGLEGVVAKKKDSQYEEGLRTGSWLKIKKLKTCDCVIFGYTRGMETREKTFGALLLGVYDNGKPVYLGKVGTGFTQEMIRILM